MEWEGNGEELKMKSKWRHERKRELITHLNNSFYTYLVGVVGVGVVIGLLALVGVAILYRRH